RQRRLRAGVHPEPAGERGANPRANRGGVEANRPGQLRPLRGMHRAHSHGPAASVTVYPSLRRVCTEPPTECMSGMAERSYRGLFWGLALGGVALDQIGKYGIFTWLYNNGQGGYQQVVPGAFRLVAAFSGQTDPGGVLAPLRTVGGDILPMVNHGALFGLGNSPGLANWVFAVVSIVAAVGHNFLDPRPG